MARPTKLTRPLLAKYCAELRKGHSKNAAAGCVGVHRDTVQGWAQRGREARSKLDEGLAITENEKLYIHAIAEIEIARDYGEWFLVEGMQAGGRDWARYARRLESVYADTWLRRPAALEVSSGHGGTIEVRLAFDPAEKPDRTLAEQ